MKCEWIKCTCYQVKRPDVTSNPLALLPSESPQNPQSSPGFSGYRPSIVCPLQLQAQPWCHGYLKGFNWPTIITHSFKNSLHWKKYFSVTHLGYPHSSQFLNLPIQTEHGPTPPGFSFWLFSTLPWIYILTAFCQFRETMTPFIHLDCSTCPLTLLSLNTDKNIYRPYARYFWETENKDKHQCTESVIK